MERNAIASEGAPARWVAIEPALAVSHPLYGLKGLHLVLLAGFAWCGLSSLARLGLLAYGLSLGRGAGLRLSNMVLTYMPVADAALVVLFAWLFVAGLRPGTRSFSELATIGCGLYVLYVVPYVFAFRHLTDTAAFSLSAWQTYVHYVLPVAFCLWALAYVNLSRRVRVTFFYEVAADDPHRSFLGGA
ncbi:MAG: hypothetical protein IT563_03555 [Alphaproteobacteria bacterium]|nr:hypothetical protein [Alphaproteobacteria bacterium]